MIKFKKKLTLEFMGEAYKDSYIEVEAVSMEDLESLMTTAADNTGNKESLAFMKEAVLKRFVGGSVDQDGKMVEVTQEDAKSLPSEVFIEAFQQIVGKVPKVD